VKTQQAFTSPHSGEALEFTVLTPIWTTNLACPFFGSEEMNTTNEAK
jgi:hypothetical protein